MVENSETTNLPEELNVLLEKRQIVIEIPRFVSLSVAATVVVQNLETVILDEGIAQTLPSFLAVRYWKREPVLVQANWWCISSKTFKNESVPAIHWIFITALRFETDPSADIPDVLRASATELQAASDTPGCNRAKNWVISHDID